MKKRFTNIFDRAWGLMMSTTSTWEEIDEEVGQTNWLLTKFVFPWVGITSIVIFAFDAIYADSKNFQIGFLHSIVNAISLIGTYFLTLALTHSFFKKKLPEFHSHLKIEKVIAYSFSVIYIIRIVTSIIPSLFFLHILDVYTVYLVWEGCRVLFQIDEDERSKIMLIISLSIIFTPAIIKKIILFMLPSF